MATPNSEDEFDDEPPFTGDSVASGIAFEGEWEEDDLMALSGKPGQSFHKVLTGNHMFDEVSLEQKKLDIVYGADEDGDMHMDVSACEEAELDEIPTPDDIKDIEKLDSVCSSPHVNADAELEWDNDTPVHQDSSDVSPADEKLPSIWRTVVIDGKNYKLDMSAISSYRQVLSHGGYYGEGLNAIVVFSACHLPDAKLPDYRYVMDNMFLYIVSTLDLLVAEDYMIIFFNGGCSRKNFPPLKWLKKCYQMIHRRLRKNLKELVIVHPTWYIRFIVGFFRPFISSKFGKKLKLVPSLHRLADLVPLESVTIPDAVQQHDVKLITSGKLELDSSDDTVDSISSQQQTSKALSSQQT